MTFALASLALSAENPIVVQLVGAFLILLGGFIVGKLLGLIVTRVLRGVSLDQHMRRVTHYRVSLEQRLGALVSFIVYVVAVIMALNRLNATRTVLLIMASLFALILIISFLLSLKDFFPNLVAGIVLRYRKDVVPGAHVRIKGVAGEVERLSLTTTTVIDHGDRLLLPNRLFLKEPYAVKKGRARAPRR